ncbi:MAG: hypothetical protein U0270_34690 [Labilithrix sp.]
MFVRVALSCALVGLAACSSSDTTPSGGTSSSSSSSSSSGGKPKDPDAKASATECKTRCGDRLKDDECNRSSTDASKACQALCLETATNGQLDCLVTKPCDDLTHDGEKISDLCPP